METFKAGDRVHVEFDGKIIETHYKPGDKLGACWLVESDNTHYYHAMYEGAGGVSASGKKRDYVKGEPANWPPEAGDVWSTSKGTYFIRDNRYSKGSLTATTANGEHLAVKDILDEMKAGKLEYRRGLSLED